MLNKVGSRSKSISPEKSNFEGMIPGPVDDIVG